MDGMASSKRSHCLEAGASAQHPAFQFTLWGGKDEKEANVLHELNEALQLMRSTKELVEHEETAARDRQARIAANGLC